MPEASEDIALQSRKILQTFVWWGQVCTVEGKGEKSLTQVL